MLDRAPEGEIEIAGGVFKHAYDGNWKVYFENLCDAAHPLFTHRSSIDAAQQQSDDVHSDGAGEIAIRQMRQNGAPYSFWESQVGIWTYPNGHSYLGDYHDDAKLVAALKDPVFREYITALERKKGKAEAKRILEVRRWNSNIYPNVSLMSQFQQMRVVHPIAVNRTVVHAYSFRLKGAPDQMFRNTISFANVVNGTGSLVLTDDLEIYNRLDLGRSSESCEWLQIGRGYQSDVPDAHGGRRGRNSTSEVYIRNMLDPWLALMTKGQAAPVRAASSGLRVMAKRRKPKAKPPAPTPRPVLLRHRATHRVIEALDLHRCERFLQHEARLLDEGKFDEWLALFTADGSYWVPSEPDQDNPHDTVSLIYDDRRLLETRVRRLASPRIYSQEPRSRTSRIVSNVSIEDSGNNSCTVRSKFLMIEYRRDSQRLFAGTAFHRLVQADGAILIASKRVNLVNCDAPLDGIVVPF